jgi:hypothetical protein
MVSDLNAPPQTMSWEQMCDENPEVFLFTICNEKIPNDANMMRFDSWHRKLYCFDFIRDV